MKHRKKQKKTFAEELMAFAHKLDTMPRAVTPAQLTALSAKLSLFAANFADFTAKTIAKAGLKPVPMSAPPPAPEPAAPTAATKTPTTESVAPSMSYADAMLTPLEAATPGMPIGFPDAAVAAGQERSAAVAETTAPAAEALAAGAVDKSKRRAAEEEPFGSKPAPAAMVGYPPDSD